VVARYENFTFRYDFVYFAAGWTARLAVVVIIRVKPFRMSVVINGVCTVFQYDALARVGDDPFTIYSSSMPKV